MESGESILEAAVREFQEETNVTPKNAHLKGVYTIVIKEDDQVIDEWMLFTFVATGVEGTPDKENREGILEWRPIEDLHHLPMAEGDRKILLFSALNKGIQYGTCVYTKEYELIEAKYQSSMELIEGDEIYG